ncbi:MAG: hypothetical protein A2Z44_11195 [Betaproteobacteria bacterium RBG_19FT_COMBO_58_11]|nr:MAG: hypothetical protein A2Z44_11195 [Betaproteobacteria bacterium RBG_19FT_COMBO_58_11]
MNKNSIRKIFLSLILLLTSQAAFSSAILSTSPSVIQAPIPSSLQKDVLQSNTTIFAYQERQGVLLNSGLLVNYMGTGTYHPALTNEAATLLISAGAIVDSYLFHFDMFFLGTGIRSLGTITFDSDILGIIGSHNPLVSTDALLGNPGTLYETTTPTFGGRGLEGANFSAALSRDWVTISGDRRTLTLDLGVGEWFDDVRVVVDGQAQAVPLPATLPLVLIGFVTLLASRHK